MSISKIDSQENASLDNSTYNLLMAAGKEAIFYIL